MTRLIAATATLAILVTAAVVQAETVQEFSYRIKDIRSYGAYTVVFHSNSYETQPGVQPAELKQYYTRLPAGATVPKVFRQQRFYCDADKLMERVRYGKGTEPFVPYINNLLKGKKTIPKNNKDLIKTCRFARIGSGTAKVQLLGAFSYEKRPVPANLMMFWTKPAPGAVAAFAIFGIPDESSPVVQDPVNKQIKATAPVLKANFYSEKSADGLFDYKLVIPSGPFHGIRFAVLEVNVTVTGMTYTKKTTKCAQKRRGKCVKRKTKLKRTFWFTRPPCPNSGNYTFETFYGYDTAPDQLKRFELHCPPGF